MNGDILLEGGQDCMLKDIGYTRTSIIDVSERPHVHEQFLRPCRENDSILLSTLEAVEAPARLVWVPMFGTQWLANLPPLRRPSGQAGLKLN